MSVATKSETNSLFMVESISEKHVIWKEIKVNCNLDVNVVIVVRKSMERNIML